MVTSLLTLLSVAHGEQTRCASDVMIILDASGSMAASDFPEGAPNRIDRVRQALSRVVPAVSPMRRLGLEIYGPGSERDSCSNINVVLKPSDNAAQTIIEAAERVRPQGRTPLTKSIEIAIEVLSEEGLSGEVVVLTDGEDTCGRDPCQFARELTSKTPGLKIHVIGYRLASLTEVENTKCLAAETGGTYTRAETTNELIGALRNTLECPKLSLQTNETARPRRLTFCRECRDQATRDHAVPRRRH